MRGFYSERAGMCASLLRLAREGKRGPTEAMLLWEEQLTDDEIAAAKREGCVGCVWSAERLKEGYAALVCAKEPQDVIVSGGMHWCGEWRQAPRQENDR